MPFGRVFIFHFPLWLNLKQMLRNMPLSGLSNFLTPVSDSGQWETQALFEISKKLVSFGLGRWLKHSSPKNLVEFLTCLTLVCSTCQWPLYNSFWDVVLPCFLCFLIAISLSLNCKPVYFELTRLCWENHTSSLFPEPFWPSEKIFWVPLSKSTSKINTLGTVRNANDQTPPLTCWQKQKLWFYI